MAPPYKPTGERTDVPPLVTELFRGPSHHVGEETTCTSTGHWHWMGHSPRARCRSGRIPVRRCGQGGCRAPRTPTRRDGRSPSWGGRGRLGRFAARSGEPNGDRARWSWSVGLRVPGNRACSLSSPAVPHATARWPCRGAAMEWMRRRRCGPGSRCCADSGARSPPPRHPGCSPGRPPPPARPASRCVPRWGRCSNGSRGNVPSSSPSTTPRRQTPPRCS